jgi:hypothetical protein
MYGGNRYGGMRGGSTLARGFSGSGSSAAGGARVSGVAAGRGWGSRTATAHAAIADGHWHSFGAARTTPRVNTHVVARASFANPAWGVGAWHGWHGNIWHGHWAHPAFGWGCCGWGWGFGFGISFGVGFGWGWGAPWVPFWYWPPYTYAYSPWWGYSYPPPSYVNLYPY